MSAFELAGPRVATILVLRRRRIFTVELIDIGAGAGPQGASEKDGATKPVFYRRVKSKFRGKICCKRERNNGLQHGNPAGDDLYGSAVNFMIPNLVTVSYL
jgi:hypothetical protein